MKGYENSYTKSGLTLSMTIMNCTNLQCAQETLRVYYSIIHRKICLKYNLTASLKFFSLLANMYTLWKPQIYIHYIV